MSQTEEATLLGVEMHFRGELEGEGSLTIEGSFEGTVRLPGGRVTVGKQARFQGSVQAQDVVVHGRMEGEIFATGRIELRDGATFVGDLFAARLSIEDFAEVRAQVDPGRAEEKPTGKRDGSKPMEERAGGGPEPVVVQRPVRLGNH